MLSSLKRLLQIAEKVIDKKSSLPILKEICFENGAARVTDLETTVVMPVPDNRSYTLPVNLLSKVLKARPHELEIALDEGSVEVLYDGQTLTYKSKDVSDFPGVPKGKFKAVGSWHRDVLQALSAQAASCSMDALKPALCGVHTTIKDSLLTIAATDGHLLRIQNGLDVSKSKPLTGILPTGPLALLTLLARGHTKVGQSDTHLSFALPGDVTLYLRLINEAYPDVASVVPAEFAGEVVFNRDMLLDLVKSARLFADRSTCLSIWQVSPHIDNLLVENLEETITWSGLLPISSKNGESIRIGFDLRLMERALKAQQSPMVRWQYSTPDRATVIKEEGEDWESGAVTVVMPVRLKEEEESHDQKRDNRSATTAGG